jgi:hypothetical protein
MSSSVSYVLFVAYTADFRSANSVIAYFMNTNSWMAAYIRQAHEQSARAGHGINDANA